MVRRALCFSVFLVVLLASQLRAGGEDGYPRALGREIVEGIARGRDVTPLLSELKALGEPESRQPERQLSQVGSELETALAVFRGQFGKAERQELGADVPALLAAHGRVHPADLRVRDHFQTAARKLAEIEAPPEAPLAAENRVQSIANQHNSALVSSFEYQYDLNGNWIEQIEEYSGKAAETTTYGYDLADRLLEVAYPEKTTVYTYDGAGNRETEQEWDPQDVQITNKVYSYNNRNQLQHLEDLLDPSGSVTYRCDANGNQTQRAGRESSIFTFDVLNRMIEVVKDGSTVGTYAYDFQGLRVEKVTSEGTELYVYDQQSVLTRSDGDGTTKFEYGPDRLLSVDDPAEGRAFYLFDALRSVINLTTPQGTLLARYQWDAWGNPRATLETGANPFGFTGHEHDDESGLVYAKARFYDPEIGIFLSSDLKPGDLVSPPSLHLYLYAFQNPTVFTDPDGLSGEPTHGLSRGYADAWRKTPTPGLIVENIAAFERNQDRELEIQAEIAILQASFDRAAQDRQAINQAYYLGGNKLEQSRLERELLRLRKENEWRFRKIEEHYAFLLKTEYITENGEDLNAKLDILQRHLRGEGGFGARRAVKLAGELLGRVPCEDEACRTIKGVADTAGPQVHFMETVLTYELAILSGEILAAESSVGRSLTQPEGGAWEERAVRGFRAQGRPLVVVDEGGNVSFTRPKGRKGRGVAVHIGFNESRGRMWLREKGRGDLIEFEVKESFLEEIRELAQPEHGAVRDRSRPWRVDVDYPDQYAIPPSLLDELEAAILPGSGRIRKSGDP